MSYRLATINRGSAVSSYGSDVGLQAFLDENGYSIPASPPGITKTQARTRASNYLDSVYGPRLTGWPSGGVSQDGAQPRDGAVTTSGQIVPNGTIPAAWVTATYFAALQEASKPGSLSIIVGGSGGDAGAVKRKKVGSLEIEYAGAGSSGSVTTLSPLLSSVDGLLAPFLGPAADDESTRVFFRALG